METEMAKVLKAEYESDRVLGQRVERDGRIVGRVRKGRTGWYAYSKSATGRRLARTRAEAVAILVAQDDCEVRKTETAHTFDLSSDACVCGGQWVWWGDYHPDAAHGCEVAGPDAARFDAYGREVGT
jgi:hypothetical protein